MARPILDVRDLRVSLKGHEILSGVTFSASAGETIAIIGPNGAGKTVLFRTLLGLHGYEGGITMEPGARIGYVPQRMDIDPYLRITVRDLLGMKRRILGLPQSKVEEAMGIVNLNRALLDKQLIDLSGGYLQRVLVAFALIGDPEILLFDEPTANVDMPGEKRIYESLHELQKARKTALILISHDLGVVNKYAKKVVCLNREMICYGETHSMLEPGILKRVFGDQNIYHHHHQPHGRPR